MSSSAFQHTHTQPQRLGKQFCLQPAFTEAFQSLENTKKPHLIYPLLIKAFGQISSLSAAKKLHACAVFAGLERYTPLLDHLICLYSGCHSITDACTVFITVTRKTIAPWNTILAACISHGHDREALSLFAKLLETSEVKPNKVTFLRALVAASHNVALPQAMILHIHIIERGLDSDLYVGNALISAYSKCSCLDDAKGVFQQMPTHDVVSWTAMIDSYAHLNNSKKALQVFRCMRSAGVKPNAITFISLIKVFNTPAALAECKEIHALIQNSGWELDPLVRNALISMYGKCGSLEEAHAMYNKKCGDDVLSWNCLLAAYAQQGYGKNALDLFEQGCKKGLMPNKVTLVSTLDACASIKALEEGRLIHAFILENNIHCDIVLDTALLNMYGKCGNVEDAQHGFNKMATQNVVSWTAIISVFSQHGHVTEALNTFYRMMTSSIRPNNVTFIAILDACTSPVVLAESRLIHFAIVCSAFNSDNIVVNALLNMYNNCGQIDDAVALFNTLSTHDVVAWTAMVGAYAHHGNGKEALELFSKMLQSSIKPNSITFICVLDTCAALSTLAEGKIIHAYIVEMELALDCDLGTALVNMYGKCGSVEEAYMVFLSLSDKDVVSWNVMLAAYAQHGHGKLALQLYCTMEGQGVQLPNSFTFISVINACSHAGLVELGQQYLDSMKPKYGITPTSEHYVCMVDLLGRAGQLEEAEKFINQMPLPPSAAVWMSYLSACRLHGSLHRGAVAAENVRKLEPQNLSAYIVLSNIYAALGRWDDLAKMGDVVG